MLPNAPGCIIPELKPYWKDTTLRLANGSTDEKYEKKTKRKATAPHNFVSDLQKDLIELGYLKTGADNGDYGAGTERAVKRFQRHALRKFRCNEPAISTVTDWVALGLVGAVTGFCLGWNRTKSTVTGWVGVVTGICDAATAKEVRTWIDKKFRLPLKVFQMTKIDGGQLREDAAKVWKEAITDAAKLGATLLPSAGPKYGDTWRNPLHGFTHTGGNTFWPRRTCKTTRA